MSSFSSKRKTRDSREQKSYVSSSGVDYPTSAPADRVQQLEISSEDQTIDSGRYPEKIGEGNGLVPEINSGGERQLGGLYNELPSDLAILRSEDRGRGIWTTVDVKAGTVLFSIRPHVHVLSRPQLASFCSSCCSPSSNLKKCTKCKAIYYCSAACQNADWGFHRSECEALHRWASVAPQEHANDERMIIPAEAVRCLGRIISKRRKGGAGSKWREEIDAMQMHRQTLAEPIESEVHLAHALVRFLGVNGPDGLAKYEIRGVGELVDLISKFATNSFTLSTPSLSPIGVAVSPLAALINHSCDPNVAILFPRPIPSALPETLKEGRPTPEPVLQVIAITDIPAKSELFTSYVDTTMPKAQRQKELNETYKFTCMCTMCSQVENITPGDLREATWCPKDCGGTCPVTLDDSLIARCSSCKSRVDDTSGLLDAMRVGQEALDKATLLSSSEPAKALRLTRNIIPILTRAKLTPATHPLLAIYRLHQSLLIPSLSTSPSQAALDEVITVAAKSVAGLSYVLRRGHPVRGVALAELAKLLVVDEPAPRAAEPVSKTDDEFPPSGPQRLRLAVATLRQALEELSVGFGAAGGGGETGREIREVLANAEKELSIWDVRSRDTIRDAAMSSRISN